MPNEAKIIEVGNCGSCPFLSDYDWQLPTKCKLYHFIIENELIIHPKCKLKNKGEITWA